MAAPTPLSPPPSMTIFFDIIIPPLRMHTIRPGRIMGFFKSIGSTAPQFFFSGLWPGARSPQGAGVVDLVFQYVLLPDLQCCYRKCHTEYRHDPESCHDLTLMVTH